MFQDLYREQPENIVVGCDCANTMSHLAYVLCDTDREDEGIDVDEAAYEIARDLLRRFPDDDNVVFWHASLTEHLGNLLNRGPKALLRDESAQSNCIKSRSAAFSSSFVTMRR